MKKFIKMLSYSKEGRNIKRLLLLPSPSIIPKKKKNDVIWTLFLTFFFSFSQNKTLFDRIYLVLALKRKNCYNLKQFKSIDGIKGVF
ncbi:hypothetical protein [Helicobacter pylori]|uniref:hypothetical protein n=1 Tax=Helicobacter pylori TaxID=210 RepID=UPI00165B489C|nr:hypothetical protein [Helicobacter pylori]